MKLWTKTLGSLWAVALAFALILVQGGIARGQAQNVTVTEDAACYTLDNGIVKAMVAKSSGDLVSLRYKNMEILATFLKPDGTPDLDRDPPGENLAGLNRTMTDHQYGFWSHDAMGPRGTGDAIARISIDPKSNGGERDEVSIKGISNGRLMGTGPGARQANPDGSPHKPGDPGNFMVDIEIRWALGRSDSGVYTYCQFEHKQEYARTTITEARFCAKLADMFDWMSVTDDEHHNKQYPSTLREGDKYIYTTNQYNNPAFGWSSTTKNVGFFIINPSNEYMSGGPTKIEFLGHRDTNGVAAPCVLNYWRSSHYGGAEVAVGANEPWTKVIGPFMLYVNSGTDSQAIYRDAKAQGAVQQKAWPFNWVKGVDYPVGIERATVKGQLVLTDPQAKTSMLPNLLVGLTAPAYQSAAGGFGGGAGRMIDWQQDAKHYEFWIRGKEDGSFAIPNVRSGTYTMHAFADGVLGEFAKADITIETAKSLDMGKITWTPVRKGKQLWEIGVPNRYGKEFFKGESFWTPNIAREYADLFPNDIEFTIGKSDITKDWMFLHVPHFDATAAPPPAPARGGGNGTLARGATTAPGALAGAPTTAPGQRAGAGARAGGRGATTGPALARGSAPTTGPGARGAIPGGFGAPPQYGRPTPRTVVFDLPSAPRGKATLRIAFSGTSAQSIDVKVNDKPAAAFTRLPGDGVLSSHGQHGIWHEKEVSFDASLMQQGTNKLVLTVPGGALNNGVIYDYLRLELDEAAQPTAMAQ